ncbi:MAG: cytochrome-c oxidase, cbb3-type subunit III [Alphaproteobacteria bacterium]
MNRRIDNQTKDKQGNASTTGHSWDGIQEYNNPLPRWWVWVFMLCIVFAIGYVIYYPAIPGGKEGTSGWTSLKMLNSELAAGQEGKAGLDASIAQTDVLDIQKDPNLNTYATAAGKALFAMHCSQCHGSGGAGVKGYPNLLDDEWIHGGSLSAIAFTITHGVRNTTDAEARNPGNMLAFGKDEVLTHDQIQDVANYLATLAYGYAANESTQRGATVFAENCTSCHGNNGEGNRDMGAPPLNNAIWQYGNTTADRMDVIANGRAGVMPAWGPKLTPTDIKKLAVYVHGLGGGEAEAVAAPMVVDASATVPSPTEPTAQ